MPNGDVLAYTAKREAEGASADYLLGWMTGGYPKIG